MDHEPESIVVYILLTIFCANTATAAVLSIIIIALPLLLNVLLLIVHARTAALIPFLLSVPCYSVDIRVCQVCACCDLALLITAATVGGSCLTHWVT